jgi:PAS domain S-box-containing protein
VTADWSVVGAERLLDEIAARTPAIIFALDADGTVTLAAGQGVRAAGYRPGQMVGADVFQNWDSPLLRRVWQRLQSGEAVDVRFPLDDDKTLQIWMSPVMAGGRLQQVLGFGFDLSEQLEVARDRRTYRSLSEASPQFIAIIDTAGKVRYLNPGGRTMVGLPLDHVVNGMDWTVFFSAAELERIEQVGIPAVELTGRYEGEGTLRHWETGREIPVHNTTFVLRDAAGRRVGYATIRSDITEIVAARELERELAENQRSMLLHLHAAQDAERRRIAGDVHDDTIQVLAAVNLRLQILRRLVATQADPGAVIEALGLLDESVRGATGRLRSLLLELDPPPVDQVGIEEQIRRRAESVLADEGVLSTVECRLVTPPAELVGGVLLRIAQEALTNVKKHAQAEHVVVSLDEQSADYILRVEDDGVGLPTGRIDEGHLGVRSMVERAESIGGRCSFFSAEGCGTTVEAVLPVRIGHVEDLRAANAKLVLEQTMANFSEGYLALDNDWRIVFANKAVYEHTARDPADSLIGLILWDVFDEAVAPEFAAAYRNARQRGKQITVTGFFPPTGRWMENRVVPTASGISIFGRDVSEQVRLAQEAAAQEFQVRGGALLVHALATEPDTATALQRALDLVLARWNVSGAVLRVFGEGGLDRLVLRAGDTADDLSRGTLPVATARGQVGVLELIPRVGEVNETLASFFGMRIAADWGVPADRRVG